MNNSIIGVMIPNTNIKIIKKLANGNYPVLLGVTINNPSTFVVLKLFNVEDPVRNSSFYIEKTLMSAFKEKDLMSMHGIIENLITTKNQKYSAICMPYAEHGDLYDYFTTREPFPEVVVRSVFHEMVGAVCKLHQRNICHTDLKLENFFLTGSMNIVLGDFGIAVNKDDELSFPRGTMNYRPIESLNETCRNSFLLDVYALGVILFIMLQGIFPYKEKASKENGHLYDVYHQWFVNDNERFWKFHTTHSKRGGKISESFKEIINSMLNPDVSKRPSLSEVVQFNWYKSEILSKVDLQRLLRDKITSKPHEGQVRRKVPFSN